MYPQRTAVEWLNSGGKRMTFGEWQRLTLSTAWALSSAVDGAQHWLSTPVLPGHMVMFALHSGPHLFALLTGVARVGGVACPLDPSDSIETLENVINNFEPELVVVDDALCEELRRRVGANTTAVYAESDLAAALACVTAESLEEAMEQKPHQYLPSDTAMVTLTSGTTGVPKGVQITARGLRSLTTFAISDDAVAPGALAPLMYMGSVTWVSMHLQLAKVVQGCTLLHAPRYDKDLFFRTLVERKLPSAFMWPMIMVDLVDLDAGLMAQLQATVKEVIYGGAKIPPSVIIDAQRLLPDTNFVQGYGQSETFGLGMLSPADHKLALQADPLPEAVLRILGSAGKPARDTELKVVGPDLHDALPQGEIGMLLARSKEAFTGYWRNEEKTRATLTDDGWVVTGDFGYIDEDGYTHVEGRGSETIVLATGANVYPHEIEATLTELAGVREIGVAKVRVRLGKRVGSVNGVGVVVVPKEGVRLDSEAVERDITEALQQRNAATWQDMTEGARLDTNCKPFWVQIRNGALPRNKNGKVMKKQLGRRASSLLAASA